MVKRFCGTGEVEDKGKRWAATDGGKAWFLFQKHPPPQGAGPGLVATRLNVIGSGARTEHPFGCKDLARKNGRIVVDHIAVEVERLLQIRGAERWARVDGGVLFAIADDQRPPPGGRMQRPIPGLQTFGIGEGAPFLPVPVVVEGTELFRCFVADFDLIRRDGAKVGAGTNGDGSAGKVPLRILPGLAITGGFAGRPSPDVASGQRQQEVAVLTWFPTNPVAGKAPSLKA